MSDVKISALTSLAVGDIDTSADIIPIVDTSAVVTKQSTVKAIVDAGLKAPGAVGGTTPAAITGTNVLATALLGYTTGAGGTVTQNTSITNTVTINKACGRIITYNETTPVTAFTSTLFSVVNSTVSAGDIIVLALASAGSANVMYSVESVLDGGFNIRVNILNTAAVPAVTLSFAVINNVTS